VENNYVAGSERCSEVSGLSDLLSDFCPTVYGTSVFVRLNLEVLSNVRQRWNSLQTLQVVGGAGRDRTAE